MINIKVEDNMGLVNYTIKKYIKIYPHDDIEDLFQIGCIGLIKASKRYNPEIGTWSSYAVRSILNELMMYKKKDNKKLKECSFNNPAMEDKTGEIITYKELLDDKTNTIDEVLFGIDFKNKFNKVLNSLKERDKEMIKLCVFSDFTQEKIAKLFNLKQSQVSRIYIKFKNKLKKELK